MTDSSAFEEVIHQALAVFAASATSPSPSPPPPPPPPPLAHLDQIGPLGSTPLIMCCTDGNEAAVRALVHAGATINLEALEFDDDEDGDHAWEPGAEGEWKMTQSPLISAVATAQPSVVKLLLSLGADANKGTSDTGATALTIACAWGYRSLAETLLAHHADPNKARTDNGVNPLCIACHEGYLTVVQVLLKHSADVAHVTTEEGSTPLILAAQEGHLDIVRLLLASSALVDTPSAEDRATPLLLASKAGHFPVVKVLLAAGADPNAADRRAVTPLFAAAKHGFRYIVKYLVASGAHPSAGISGWGGTWTPTSVAKKRGHDEIALFLDLVLGNGGGGGDGGGGGGDEFKGGESENVVVAGARSAAAESGGGGESNTQWSPLRVAAACKLHRVIVDGLRYGRITPDAHGLQEHYRVRETARFLNPLPFGPTLHESRWLLPPGGEHGADDDEDDEEACSTTLKVGGLVAAATSGWSPITHQLHHKGVRDAVHTLLLIAERLWQLHASAADKEPGSSTGTNTGTGSDGSDGSDGSASVGGMPSDLPPEIWRLALSFVLRQWWAAGCVG